MPIRHVLVANRGEIARRVFRTCRALGIRTTAVYSEVDRHALHVREADVAVCIGAGEPGASYLNGDVVIAAAKRTGADAIHPGYGFLSENAAFADQVIAAGLAWIGPPPSAMRALGNKAAARATAEAHGIPVVPGYDGSDPTPAAFAAAAERIGYPVLIKASSGGGGRGMRRVDEPGQLADALESARREARAAFGSERLLLERYVARPRHVEVQVLGDAHGHVVHLFERECSIQRRHQKIIEEAPSPGVDDALRTALGDAAVRVATAAGYTGAGTVEFLVDGERFYLLEMNARLQVEHPVTECITGLDLVALQIHVAEGRPLPFDQSGVRRRGHAIEARLCAEDPMRDFLPQSGRLLRFDVAASDGVRVDAGYETGQDVPHHYDSLLAKVIAWGDDRAQATRRVAAAVERAWVPGVATNLPLLRQIFATPAWAAGELHTGFLAEQGLPHAPPLNLERGALAATVVAWASRPQGELPAGWRISGPARQTDRWRCGDAVVEAGWTADGDGLLVDVGGWPQRVRVLARDGDAWTVEVGEEAARWRVARGGSGAVDDGERIYVHLGDGEAFVELVPRFPPPVAAVEPGSLVATTPGKVVQVAVAVGDAVEKGQLLVVLEAMKMEHRVTAPSAGTVAQLRVRPGDVVDQGALLVKLDAAS